MTTSAKPTRNPPRLIGRGRIAGLALVVALAVLSHARWRALRDYGLHIVPAMSLGLILLTLVDGLVAIVRGCVRPRTQVRHWLAHRGTWLAGLWRVAFVITVTVLFYSVERWRGHRMWASAAREFQARGGDVNERSWNEEPVQSNPDSNIAHLPMFAPLMKELRRRIETVEDGFRADLGPLAKVQRWDFARYHSGRAKRKPLVAPWMTQESTDFHAWLRTWPSAGVTEQAGAQGRGQTNGVPLNDDPGHPPLPLAQDTAPAGAAALVLGRLQEFEPMLDVLRGAGDRTVCRFPLDYERQTWRDNPVLPVLNGFASLFRLRASALLTVGKADEAFAEIRVLLRVLDYARQQRWAFVGTHRLWVALEAMQPIWEGVRAQRWSPDQWAALQRQLADLNLLNDFDAGLRNDAFALADAIESFVPSHATRVNVPTVQRRSEELDAWLTGLRLIYPRGWSLRNQAAILRLYLRFTAASGTDDPLKRARLTNRVSPVVLALESSDPLFPVLIVPKAVQLFEHARLLYPGAHAAIETAVVACALERVRLEHGSYPATLSELAPRWMTNVPHDPVTGEPLQYRREKDGYRLYSLGIDSVDGGGQPGARNESQYPVLGQGDWVWH